MCSPTISARFKYILVDEYQDTNIAQYLWLRLIAQRRAEQSLLRRRRRSDRSMAGAAPRSRTSCVSKRIFPAPRSSAWNATTARRGHILAAASHLISHNEGRLGKTLFTDGERGRKADASPASGTAEEEARSIGEDIEQLQRKDHSLDEIAILVRASFQMREFEERFVEIGLPYRVIGGPRFYERARNPRRARLSALRRAARRRSRLRAHHQYAQARSRRRDAANAA